MKKDGQPPPGSRVPLAFRLVLAAGVVLGGLEVLAYTAATGILRGPLAAPLLKVATPVLLPYLRCRRWLLEHLVLSAAVATVGLVVLLLLVRTALLVWHNQVVARLSGTYFQLDERGFPSRPVDLLSEVGRRPPGATFVGLTPRRGLWRWRWRPVYLTQEQRTMHRHVLGKTGSGKTSSVLWPQVLQDALDGKAVVVMDAKGSDENIRMMKAIAAMSGRASALRVFSLPAWNQPQLFSHAYNLLWVRPPGTRGPTDPGGDAAAAAERVFATMKAGSLGDNVFYNTQAEVMFTNLVRLLHGVVDEDGRGLPFTVRDVAVLLKGLGVRPDDPHAKALQHCRDVSREQDVVKDIASQMDRLGPDLQKAMSGVIGAADKLLSPLVNAYEPDIVLEDVLEKNLLLYVQLPANLFKIQAPAIGRAILMDLQHEGSLRQVFRTQRSQGDVSVCVDEFYNFADLHFVDSLNKLRDARFQLTLLHQSPADLELVSKEFAKAVWDNTRTRDVLNQDNPQLCDELAKSIGTHQVVEMTVRRKAGALFTSLATGDASSKLVETYRVHPNCIKNLAPAGQGYLVTTSHEPLPICYGMMPPLSADYALARKDQSKARGIRLHERFVRGAVPKDQEVVEVLRADARARAPRPPP